MGRIILGAFLLLAAPIAFANSLTGKVVKITDGDTLYVLDTNYKEHKIRLAGLMPPSASRRMDWLPASTWLLSWPVNKSRLNTKSGTAMAAS